MWSSERASWALAGAFLTLLTLACDDSKSKLSPEALTQRLEDKVWSYELWEPYPGTEQPLQEVDGLWLGSDGRFERYLGFTATLTGTWKVADGPVLELLADGAPGGVPLPYAIEAAGADGVTMKVPGRPDEQGLPTEVERTYTGSDRCPPYLSRSDGRYANYFLGIHDPQTQYEGWQAVDFDSEGDLHVIAARFNTSQEGFYATTMGARCGLLVYTFAPQAGAVMEIDGSDVMHVAYGDGPRIYYASRPARAAADVEFDVTMVGTNTGAGPKVALAVAPDGSVAIVATGDGAEYTVFRSKDPRADSPVWEQSNLPVQRDPGNQLVFGVSLAFDPESRLHAAASPDGFNLTVYRDDGEAWTALPVTPLPVFGTFFEGPKAFRIDDKGTWHLAAGSIGTVNSQFGAGRPGALLYGKGDEKGVSWRVVGAGGLASIDFEDPETVHLFSLDRMLGGMHTIVRGEEITRYRATARESTLDRMTMGVGPKGRVGFGVSEAVQVLFPEEELPEHRIAMRVGLKEAQGAKIVLPELDVECGDMCAFDVTDGRILQWSWDAPPGIAPSSFSQTQCVGRELTGTCWTSVSDDTCERGMCPLTLDVTFASSQVAGFTDLVSPEEGPTAWVMGGPHPGAEGGFSVALARVQGTPTSRVLRFTGDAVQPTSTEIMGWSGAEVALGLSGGSSVVLGHADGQTTLGGETGFAGEQVAVGLDSKGQVTWVDRGPATQNKVVSPIVSSAGVAFVSEGNVVALAADGTRRYTTALPSLAERKAYSLVADGDGLHVLGPLREEVAQSSEWLTRWTELDADGKVVDERDLPGWIIAASLDPKGELAVAMALRAGQTWDGAALAEDALCFATYDPQRGDQIEAGKPDASQLAALGAPAGWTGMAVGSVIREDGSLLVVHQAQPSVTSVLTFKSDSVELGAQLGGQGGVAASARYFYPAGLAAIGNRVWLGGFAQGSFDFGAIKANYQSQTPVLVELP